MLLVSRQTIKPTYGERKIELVVGIYDRVEEMERRQRDTLGL